MPIKRTSTEVAEIIERFVDGHGGVWDWDDFSSIRISDAKLDEIRIACVQLYERFPSDEQGRYCSRAGIDELRRQARVARELDAA